MASLLDIEDTLSDETTKDIVCKQWYWNVFLPKIDKDNIRNDYRLVYKEFSEHEWMSFPYNYPEHAWEWLLENKIIVISSYDYSDLYGWYDKYEDQPKIYRQVDNCYKYRLTDKFFEDYQKNAIERRKLSVLEAWMEHMGNLPHRLYKVDYTTKTINDLKKYNYAWPITFEASI